MGKSLIPSRTEIPFGWNSRMCPKLQSCCVQYSHVSRKSRDFKIRPVLTWQLCSLRFMHKMPWCPRWEGWEYNKCRMCTSSLLPWEVNMWVSPPRISASAESTRQTWEHLTLPLLSLPPRSKLPSPPHSPGGVATSWWNTSLGKKTQSGENYKQTNQPKKKTKRSRTHKKPCRNRVVSQLASDPIHQTSHLLDYLL